MVMNYPLGCAKLVSNVMLNELDHIRVFDLLESDDFNPLRKILGNCKSKPISLWWWQVNWLDNIYSPCFEWPSDNSRMKEFWWLANEAGINLTHIWVLVWAWAWRRSQSLSLHWWVPQVSSWASSAYCASFCERLQSNIYESRYNICAIMS